MIVALANAGMVPAELAAAARPLLAIVASAVGAALVGAGVSSWIDAAPEGPEGPVTERDYRAMLPRCSYRACGAESAGTVADFELCRDHLDALLPVSATPSWV